MKKIIVIALGGNAILKKGEEESISKQFSNTKKAIKHILTLANNFSLVISHGNGPQVGNILVRVENSLKKAYDLPLEVCVAQSEGEMGYMIEQVLYNELIKSKINKKVVSILTQVIVNKNDKSFKNPTKPIGSYYTKKQAFILAKKFAIKKDSRGGYRRVVASPLPLKIIEADVIKNLVKKDIIVIAAGGGGIPVYEKNKILKGIEAVIDKDLASACLAKSINANILLILTDIKKVFLNFKKRNQKEISRLNLKDAKKYLKEGHFLAGSMGPKIEAAISFLENGGEKVIITSPKFVEKAIKGLEGTHIFK